MNEQKLIKHFKSGVVGWSLFSDFWDRQHAFIEKINHLLETSEDEGGWGINIAFDLIEVAQKEIEEYWETAKKEKEEAGGNSVSTIKNEDLNFREALFQLQEGNKSADNGRSHVVEGNA